MHVSLSSLYSPHKYDYGGEQEISVRRPAAVEPIAAESAGVDSDKPLHGLECGHTAAIAADYVAGFERFNGGDQVVFERER